MVRAGAPYPLPPTPSSTALHITTEQDVSCNLYITRNEEFQFIWQKLYSRERQMPYSTWRKLTSGGVLSKDVLKIFAKFTDKHLFPSLFFNKLQAGNLKLSEAVTGEVLSKKVFLKRRTGVLEPALHRSSTKQMFLDNSQNSREKTCFGVFF